MKITDLNYSLFLKRQAMKGERAEMKKLLQVCDNGGEGKIKWNSGKK